MSWISDPNTGANQTPETVPRLVYRVQPKSAQTRYTFATGFDAKNKTTILNLTSLLSRFGLAHLNQQTNISSPFISVYSDLSHAEAVARHWAQTKGEDVYLVTIDTQHLGRGPIFRAVDILKDDDKGLSQWLHHGEYLVLYKIPPQACRNETLVRAGDDQKWKAVGVIGGA